MERWMFGLTVGGEIVSSTRAGMYVGFITPFIKFQGRSKVRRFGEKVEIFTGLLYVDFAVVILFLLSVDGLFSSLGESGGWSIFLQTEPGCLSQACNACCSNSSSGLQAIEAALPVSTFFSLSSAVMASRSRSR